MIWSKYARDLLVGAALRGGTITFPATYYLAYLTGAPNISTDAYTEIGNVNPRGYARKSIANGSVQWAVNAANDALSSNLNAQVFADPTGNWTYGAGTDASLITHIGLFDSGTIGAGNLWFYTPVSPKKVEAGQFNVTIPVGGLALRFDR